VADEPRRDSDHPAGLDKEVEKRRLRVEERQRHGERPLLAALAAYGALGWLVVIPALLGLFLGRYIDRRAGTGLVFSAGLLFAGVTLGAFLAWRKMHEEP